MDTINQLNTALATLNSGSHEAVHKWAEEQIKIDKEKQQLRRRIAEALLTKTATIVLAILLILLVMGGVSYIEHLTQTKIPLPSIELSP